MARNSKIAPAVAEPVADPLADAERRVETLAGERSRLQERHNVLVFEREAALQAGNRAKLAEMDHAAAELGRDTEIVLAQYAAAVTDLDDTRAKVDGERRRAAYDSGLTALETAREIMATKYMPAALAVRDVVTEALGHLATVHEANANLPDGVLPIPQTIEPDNSFPSQAHSAGYIRGSAHRSVAEFLNLPSLTVDQPYVFSAPRWGQPR